MDNTASQSKECSFDEKLETRNFMREEVFTMTLMAVTQHGRIYAPQPTQRERDEFRSALHKYLDGMAKVYSMPVAEEAHVHYIVSLKEQLSASCKRLHDERGFRIGSAQKALNLFLKYLWCLGEIPEPPHCPFDRRIIEGLELPVGVCQNWADCDHVEHYERWVAAAREEAKKESLSLAQWELCTYNK